MYAMTSGGPQSTTLNKQQIEGPDYKTIQPYIDDKSYLNIVDFDDHFENVENDWLNRECFK